MATQTTIPPLPATVPHDSVHEIYADGVAYSFLGVPTSKITLYSLAGHNEDGTEQRKLTVRLTLPTNVLLELCRNTLAFAKQSGEQLDVGYDHLKLFGQTMLGDVSVSPAPVVPLPTFANKP